MTHIIYAVTLMLFVISYPVNAAQQKPLTKARTEQDKRDADAAEYRRRVAALGGKMLHLDDDAKASEQKHKPKLIDTPTTSNDIRPKL
jgi:hypothetical protein